MAGTAILMTTAMVSAQTSLWPQTSWPMATPESQGMGAERLREALEYAAGPNNLRSHCASIHRNGFVVAEGYWKPGQTDPNATTMLYSISKAFATTLVGAAERDGLLDTEDEAHNYDIPQWRGTTAERITVDMLLRHDSGRYYGSDLEDIGIPQFAPLDGSPPSTDPSSQTEYAIGIPMEYNPGQVTEYNQMAFQSLERVLRRGTKDNHKSMHSYTAVPPCTQREARPKVIFEVLRQAEPHHTHGWQNTACGASLFAWVRYGRSLSHGGRWRGSVPRC